MAKEILSSVSLIPSDKDIEAINPVIEDLAKRYSTTPFLPHLTIWGNITAPLSVVEDAARSAIEGIGPFSVEVDRIDHKKRWSKTLFMQIKPNEILIEIHRRLAEKLKNFTDYDLNPHVSLIYKREMTEEEKLREIPNLHVPESFTIDSIVITVPGDPIEKWENVAMWKNPVQIRL